MKSHVKTFLGGLSYYIRCLISIIAAIFHSFFNGYLVLLFWKADINPFQGIFPFLYPRLEKSDFFVIQ